LDKFSDTVQTHNATASSTVNLDSTPTADGINYMKIGNMVTVWGNITSVDPTSNGTLTSFEITPPIASVFVSADNASGQCIRAANATQLGAVRAVVATGNLEILFVSATTASHTISFNCVYKIL
jgi:hypothetical protein